MMDSSKHKKVATTISGLPEIQLKKSPKTLHCWGCGKSSYAKNDPNCLKKKKA